MFGDLLRASLDEVHVLGFKLRKRFFQWTCLAWMALCGLTASAQRYVIADQDASGPGGSDMMALLVFLQSPDVHLLGITVVSGDSWWRRSAAPT